MKTSTLLLSGLGSSAAFLGLYYFWNSKGENAENKKVAGSDKPQKPPLQRKLSFRVNVGEGLDIQDPDVVQVLDTRPSIVSRSPLVADTPSAHEDPADEGTSVVSYNSLTSCDSSVACAEYEQLANVSNNSSSESETGIVGAVGPSTYHSMQENLGLGEDLDELTHSPVVTPLFTDKRFQRRENEDRSNFSPSVVREYDGCLAPVDVTENIDSYSETYSSIVPPLEPNTGTVIPPVQCHNAES